MEMITQATELTRQRDFMVNWLVKLDAMSNRPNDGWPPHPGEPGILRQALRDHGMYREEFNAVHEFTLLRALLGLDYSPNKDAAATARTIRAELAQVEIVLEMQKRSDEFLLSHRERCSA